MQANDVQGYPQDLSCHLQEILNNADEQNDNDDSMSDTDSDAEQFPDQFFSTASSILKTVLLKMHVVSDLSDKTNSKPARLAKTIHFMRSALLLLSNSQFKPQEEAGTKVDAILKAHGLQRLPVVKDGNCLFAAVSFFLLQAMTSVHCGLELREHLNCIGIFGNKTLPEMIVLLRKLVVDEFLSCNLHEYSSFLLSAEHTSYEETARNFERDGFFDCELGNAVILALSNILRISIVVFTSLENYPIITIVPKQVPVSNTPAYLAFEQVGAGHYDAVIESKADDKGLSERETLSANKEPVAETIAPTESHIVCRCGQGGAKNKQNRKFCAEYKSSCKCFQKLTGCTSACGCYNCANTYGARSESSDERRARDPQPRKRRKHGLPKETGRDFMVGRGEKVAATPWSLFEELLCIECTLHIGINEDINNNIDNITEFYNNIISLIKEGTLTFSEDFSTAVGLQTIELKGCNSVKYLLKKLCKENAVFEDAMRQQIELNVL